MYTNQETLTPKQLYICSGVIVSVFIAFSSVFVYAYWKGNQVRTNQAQAQYLSETSPQFEDLDVYKKATKIARGHRGQALNTHFNETPSPQSDSTEDAPNWVLFMYYPPVKEGLQRASPIIAASGLSSEWRVTPTAVIQVPKTAELGLYKLQYPQGEYLFEVIKNETEKRLAAPSSPSHQPSPLKFKNFVALNRPVGTP